VPSATRCATLDVPLDHSGRIPGTQHLRLAVVPARGPRVGTLTLLPGGPGQPAVPFAAPFGRLLRSAAPGYDLLLVDPRGTGGSDPVSCRLTDKLASVTACGEKLGARRATLTTSEQVSDLEDVRAQLGIPKLTLLGVSYGTKVAAEYLRRYPDRTERAVLDSPTPPEALDTEAVLRAFALPRVLREVCYPPGCRSFLGPDPVAAVKRLVDRLEAGPLRASAITPSGRRRPVRITLPLLATLVAVTDVDPFARVDLPAAVGSALRGDGAPLARIAARLASGPPEDEATASNDARFLATSCVEGRFPWSPDSPLAGREQALSAYLDANARAFAPFPPAVLFTAAGGAACLAWPPTPKPATPARPAPAVPTLIIAGRDDLRTPVEDARRSAGDYPTVRLLNVPDVGHSVLTSDVSACALRGLRAFLAGQTVRNCPRGPRPLLGPAPFVPASLAALRPAPGLPGTVGRTVTALGATVLDAARQGVERATGGIRRYGGLRGGTAAVSARGVTMRGYEVVRGVRVSGTVSARGAGTLAVTGSGATGRLVLRGARVRGTLDGRRVSAPLPGLRS
jgi:pimeloyl-ACP methyl ester carboxylesterase